MLNLLFPRGCSGCKSVLSGGEKILCVACRHSLPLISHHISANQGMKQIFYGRFPVVQATALLEFQKKGTTQNLLHALKYRGRKEISSFFGKWLGAELSQIETYQSIDMVIPVPLHKNKLKKRGYNQVEGFGKEIAKALDTPYRDDILLKSQKQILRYSSSGLPVFRERICLLLPIKKT